MPRERREFPRLSGFRDASLIVIASEGARTEPSYFNGLRERFRNPRLHVRVLDERKPFRSSPEAVLQMLEEFNSEFKLKQGDQLWLVITPARKFRMLLHTNPTRERGECLGTRAGALEDM